MSVKANCLRGHANSTAYKIGQVSSVLVEVSRVTVRRAVAILISEGLLQSLRGVYPCAYHRGYEQLSYGSPPLR